ncbi:MAG: hypothetical protein RI911_288, partial [Candidatus Parcubacteria bacterium]
MAESINHERLRRAALIFWLTAVCSILLYIWV